MRRFVGIGAAWLAATLVAVAVAAAAVGSVRSEVADTPTVLAAPLVATSATVSASDLGSSTTTDSDIPQVPITTARNTETTTTLDEADTSGSSEATTTTPPVASSSTTTTTGASSYTKTYDTEAGTVRITVSGESVTFSGATPLPGWKVELKNSGPEEVNVHFERNEDEHEDKEIKFKATIEDGELRVSISEES